MKCERYKKSFSCEKCNRICSGCVNFRQKKEKSKKKASKGENVIEILLEVVELALDIFFDN